MAKRTEALLVKIDRTQYGRQYPIWLAVSDFGAWAQHAHKLVLLVSERQKCCRPTDVAVS